MKKLILITMATLMLTACQPTPEQNTVVEKDTDRMVEQAMPESTEQTIPTISELVPQDRYIYEETGADGKLTLTMDAEIVAPDVDYMPITEVSMAIFTQEQVTALFNNVFSDEKPIDVPDIVETKPMYEEEILRLKQELAQTDDATQKQEISNQIANLESIYDELPEEQPVGEVSDGTMENHGGMMILDASDENHGLHAYTFESLGQVSNSAYINYNKFNRIYPIEGEEFSGELSPEVEQNVGYSYEQALKMCYEHIALLGYDTDEFYPREVVFVQEEDIYGNKLENFTLNFSFARTIDGNPGFITETGQSGYAEFSAGESFSVSWGYEIINISVDNRGVNHFLWMSPVDIGENVTDRAVLMPFEEISTVYENMIMTTYGGFAGTVLGGEYDVGVDTQSAELMHLRIREQGEETKGLYVPAWVFRGSVSMTNSEGETRYIEGAEQYTINISPDESGWQTVLEDDRTDFERYGREEELNVPLLVVNAVDGSIIDLNKGY